MPDEVRLPITKPRALKTASAKAEAYRDDDRSAGVDETDPTLRASEEFSRAFEFFNARLFAGRLPQVLMTPRPQGRSYGYFAADRFGTQAGQQLDEIALNLKHFRHRTIEESLSTVVHEMCHCGQLHFGTPSRSGYHNKEWARLMESRGLMPSHTGQPGGRKTGQTMSHYIVPGGPFDIACRKLIDSGFTFSFADLWKDKERAEPTRAKYTCPDCGFNAWGKPGSRVGCGQCSEGWVRMAMVGADQTIS
jgi:hypothetical protein